MLWLESRAAVERLVSVSEGIRLGLTPPTTVSVSDDGATTASTTTLHATKTPAGDPESGSVRYDDLIRQDSITGPIVRNWTSLILTPRSRVPT